MSSIIEAGSLVYNFVSKGFAELHTNLRFVERYIHQLSGVVALADPVGVRRFNVELQVLGAYIGRIFIPVMNELTRIVQQVGEYFASMTPQQRQAARDLVLYGAAAVVGTIAAGALASALLVYTVAIAKATVATVAFLLSNPVGWVLAAVGAIATLMTAVVAFGVVLGVAGQKGASWAEKFGNAWKAVMSFVGPVFEQIGSTLKQIGAIGGIFFEELIDVIGQFGVDWAEVWKFVGEGFKLFLGYFVQAVKWFALVLAAMINGAILGVKTLLKIMIQTLEALKAVASYVPMAGFAVEGADKALGVLNQMKEGLDKVKGFNLFDLNDKFNAGIEQAKRPSAIQNDQAQRVYQGPVIKDIKQVFIDAQQAKSEAETPELRLQRAQLEIATNANAHLRDIRDAIGNGVK